MKKAVIFLIVAIVFVSCMLLYEFSITGKVIDDTYCNKRCSGGEVCFKFNSYDGCLPEKDVILQRDVCKTFDLPKESKEQCIGCLSYEGNKFYNEGGMWRCQVLDGQCGGDCIKRNWLDEKIINNQRRYIYGGRLGGIKEYLCQNPETICFIPHQTLESISDEELIFSIPANPENIEQAYSYYSDKEDEVYNDYYKNYKIFYDFLIRLDTEKTIWTIINGESVKISGAIGGTLNYFFQIPDYSFEKENISDINLFTGPILSIDGYLPLNVVEGEIYHPDEKKNSCFILVHSNIQQSDLSNNILFKKENNSMGFTGSIPITIQYWCGSLKVNSCQYGMKKGNLRMDNQIREIQEIYISPEEYWIKKSDEKEFGECMEKLFGDPEINKPKKSSEKENPNEGVPIPNAEADIGDEGPSNLEGTASQGENQNFEGTAPLESAQPSRETSSAENSEEDTSSEA